MRRLRLPMPLLPMVLLWMPGYLASDADELSLPIISSAVELAPGARLPSAGADLVGSALTTIGSWLAISAPSAGNRGAVHLVSLHDAADPSFFATLQHGSSSISLSNGDAFGSALAGLADPTSSNVAGFHLAIGATEAQSSTGSVYLVALSARGSVTR